MRPGSTLIPTLRYRNCEAAVRWLCGVLGFSKHVVYPGPNNTVAHAELTLGHGMVMLGSAANASSYGHFVAHPDDAGGRTTAPMYVVVPDCNAVYARAQEARAEVVQDLRTMDYGGLAFTVRDPEGYLWSVGEYDPWNQPTSAAPEAARGTSAGEPS